ncbi:MAG: hypothetical protein QM758_13190 [Armatimonas sp.]
MNAPQTTERFEAFDREPGWEAHNNRIRPDQARTIRQDFGYSATKQSVGGFLTPDGSPAYYARKISPRTFQDTLTASGTLTRTSPRFHALIGFFHSATVNEWRTPNTIAIRLMGRGDVFYAYVEYATGKWRAGADSPGGFATVTDPATGAKQLKGFSIQGKTYRWSLKYDPQGNGGSGTVRVTIGEETAVCDLAPGHKADGATFNRFGLLNIVKSADDGGELWLDDVTVNGETEAFDRDPKWEGVRNHRTFVTRAIRPYGDFGYSPTQYAGGRSKGELGGVVYRGDCRYPAAMASYADRLSTLTLDKPLKAGGKVSLRRGVSDSATLIGFFSSKESMRVNDSQKSLFPSNFLGACIEGPSSEGFFFYPAYRVGFDVQGYASGNDRPRLLPNGVSHTWSLTYAAEGHGRIMVTLDNQKVSLDLEPGSKSAGAKFDRFGIVTTWIDGNGQHIYFDDLTYTIQQ